MVFTPLSYAAEDGAAMATAAFRVKLTRLLDQSRLGEIQAQASSPLADTVVSGEVTLRAGRKICPRVIVEKVDRRSSVRTVEKNVRHQPRLCLKRTDRALVSARNVRHVYFIHTFVRF